MPVLGVDHPWRGLDEGAQQGLRLVSLGFHPATLIDVDEYAGKTDRLAFGIEVDPADRFDPPVVAVGAAGAVLVRIAAATPDRLGDRLGQAGTIVGVDGGHHLFQAQLGTGQRGVQAMHAGQGIVDGEIVLGHVPEPGADDGAGGQRHVDPLGITLAGRIGEMRSAHGILTVEGEAPDVHPVDAARRGAGRPRLAPPDAPVEQGGRDRGAPDAPRAPHELRESVLRGRWSGSAAGLLRATPSLRAWSGRSRICS
ncbi:hypothetical protein D3C71_1249320 [compost metagenome]